MLVNPSFETGDLTGYTSLPTGGGVINVQSSEKYDGNYACYMYTPISGNTILYQDYNLSGINNISFWLYVTKASYNREFEFKLDSQIKLKIGAPNGGWTKYIIDVSAYSGSYQLNFHGWAESTAYVDNIRLDGAGWSPTISGIVYDKNSNTIEEAAIEAVGTSTYETTSASDGTYSLTVDSDQYIVTASKSRYNDDFDTVDATSGDITKDFILTPSGTISTGIQTPGASVLGGISSGKQSIPGMYIQGGVSLGARKGRR